MWLLGLVAASQDRLEIGRRFFPGDDADFNSLEADYLNGFDGEDPVYDLTLE